jgi:putative transcriptional regulator
VAVSGADLEHDLCYCLPIRAQLVCGHCMEKNAMTCLECGSTMRTRRERVPFDKPIGLPGVQLDTFVLRCPKCHAFKVILPNIEGLHQVIARAVVAKKARLAGVEIRFLRKVLGWSGADFAEHMGTTVETVSRWENGSTPIGPQADRLLRLMVLTRDPVVDYHKLDLLKTVARAKPAAVRMTVRAGASGAWSVTRAA